MENTTYINEFAYRLSSLRQKKNISARDMSLSLGQNANFINNIELGKNFPTMQNFFYICEYLQISPAEFFNYDNAYTMEMPDLVECLKKLNKKEFDNISAVIHDLASEKK